MSLTSKSRKETTESHAARRSHNTMGMAPGMIQLSDFDIRDQQTSNRIDTNTPNVPEDTMNAKAEAEISDSDTENTPSRADIDEARRASWGQPTMEEDEMVTDEDSPRVAYRNQDHDMGASRVDDADWNTRTDHDEDMSNTRPRGMDRM
ncbi:hypothetical protein GCM10023189_47150 [Nibrella saemangeumensis]|uniref:Uncharacterized protein n=1 Tax=Nibrella saemangeumensis TaxID=1084526 RepID=A0ABP8NHB7_9BACT